MPNLSGQAELVLLLVVAALVLLRLLELIVSVRRRRALARRLDTVTTRLDVPGAGDGNSQEDTVTRLERLAESAVLRVSEAEAVAHRLAGALEELPDGVVICDEAGAVVYRNQVATVVADPSPEEAEAEDLVAEVLAAGVAGERVSSTVEIPGPPQRTLTVSGRPLDDGRRTLGAVAVVEDVSERLRLDLLRHDFVDNVAAELRTPLGALGVLATTISGEEDPKLVRRLSGRLRDDALRVARVIDDLVELSRISAEVLPQRELVPLHVVVAQAVEMSRSLAADREIAIEVGEPPRRLSVVGHRRQLVSAVRRLVDNAVSFSEPGSTVSVSVRRDGRRWVEIAVADQGPGIPGSELERIFECFYRLSGNGSPDAGGTGLGLAISSQVAGAHGGDIHVRSKEGEGSVFTLRLPVRTRSRHPRTSGWLARPAWKSAPKERDAEATTAATWAAG